MEKKIVSSWFNGKSLPESYIIPPEKRPGDISLLPSCQIPVIDLSLAKGLDHALIIHQIMQAAKKFGFFQVINHGVGREIMGDAMKVFKEFFELPNEEKSHLYSEENNVKCRLYTSSFDYANEDIHYWRDCLKHSCSPLKECMDYWPQNPARYREVVEKYCREVKEVGMKILELISEGLELESGYFGKGYSEESFLAVNHYPPCPDPRLTLGLPKHCDPNIITLLHQENIPGLQVWVDGKWLLVQPCPDAFVVNMGYQMQGYYVVNSSSSGVPCRSSILEGYIVEYVIPQIISNGRLKSAEHRVVTNAEKARTTSAFFILPSKDSIIQPAKALVNVEDPPLFKKFQYEEFVETFKAYANKEPEDVLKHYKVNCN